MELFDAIYQRRAIKSFDASHIISESDESKLFEAAIQSPTSFNIQHWRFVVVRDQTLRKEMRKLGNDQSQITDASLLIIMTADMKAWEKNPSRYWANAPKEVADLLVGWMGPFHNEREWLQRDEAQRSIGMAMQTLMLAAKGIGLDSCPMIGFDIESVAKLIKLPADHVMGPMIAIGKSTKAPWPKPGQLGLNEVLVNNTF
jgi:nitroreductase